MASKDNPTKDMQELTKYIRENAPIIALKLLEPEIANGLLKDDHEPWSREAIVWASCRMAGAIYMRAEDAADSLLEDKVHTPPDDVPQEMPEDIKNLRDNVLQLLIKSEKMPSVFRVHVWAADSIDAREYAMLSDYAKAIGEEAFAVWFFQIYEEARSARAGTGI